MRLGRLTAVVAGLCVALGVGGIPPAGGGDGPTAVTAGCTAAGTRRTWVAFLGAFSHGDYTRLNALFAVEPEFGWFSANAPGLRNAGDAYSRDTLIGYFRKRHAQDDRLRLVAFRYHGRGNFTYTLWRSALDYQNGAAFRLIGKGAVACSGPTTRLLVVSLGAPGSDKAR
jgi:hypothetical protein